MSWKKKLCLLLASSSLYTFFALRHTGYSCVNCELLLGERARCAIYLYNFITNLCGRVRAQFIMRCECACALCRLLKLSKCKIGSERILLWRDRNWIISLVWPKWICWEVTSGFSLTYCDDLIYFRCTNCHFSNCFFCVCDAIRNVFLFFSFTAKAINIHNLFMQCVTWCRIGGGALINSRVLSTPKNSWK